MTFQTEIKIAGFALAAAKAAGLGFHLAGHKLVADGDDYSLELDLDTGVLDGSGPAFPAKLGLLRQSYAEARFTVEAIKQGFQVVHRARSSNGDLVLICRVT
jgi:hypothetical protein